MAEEVRRQVVSDPLAQQARTQTPDRSLPLPGIMQSRQSAGDAAYQQNAQGISALGSIKSALAGVFDEKKDEWAVQGKMDFMTGVTEEEMLRTGNKYTQQGYEALSSVDQASSWYANELLAIDETTREMDPTQYKTYLMGKRKEALSNLPDDPAIKKLYVAAFEQYGPRLADEQFKAHNGLNKTRNINALSDAAYSSAGVNEDASRVMPGGPLRVSPGIVSPAITSSADDRDAGIRTMLGEAGGEGEVGMAAVAHVMKNRAIDGRYGGNSIYAVAHAPKQFSAWNNGPGGIPAMSQWSGQSKAYMRAAKIYDAVMSGHNADMTGGATHYYSPQGMKALAAGGSQSHLVPKWWNAQAEKNSVTIGNHRFAGKARGLENFVGREPLDPVHAPTAEEDFFGEQPTRGVDYAPAGSRTGPMAPVEPSSPVALEHTKGVSQIRQTFDASNLRDEDKAIAATDAMVRALEEGNDQVYNDLGGEAYLRELGATPTQINAVQAAKSKQSKADLDKWNVDRVRQEEDLKAAIKDGQFKTQADLFAAMEGMHDRWSGDEASFKSLANESLTEWHKYSADEKALNPQLESDLAGIRQRMVEEPNYSPDQAALDAVALGDKYDIDGKTVNGWVQDMQRRGVSRAEKQHTEMAALLKIKQNEDVIKAQVDTALKNDSGLGSITGQIRVTDEQGNEISISAEQYGVRKLKESEVQNARSLIDQKRLDPQQAEATINKIVYEKLAKQGVIDKEHSEELVSALKGDITDPKTGKISDSAVKAFDFYLQMTKNPNVGAAYMAKMIPDEDARVLLNTATTMYDSRSDLSEALRRAGTRLSQKIDPVTELKLTGEFAVQLDTGIRKILNDKMQSGFLQGDAFMDSDDKQLNRQYPKYQEDITRRANDYNVKNPLAPTEAKIKMATEDFENDAIVINGNVLLGSHAEGKRLDQVMGLDKVGPDAPQRAVSVYLHDFGEKMFPNLLEATGYKPPPEPGWYYDPSKPDSTLLNTAWNLNPGVFIWKNVIKNNVQRAAWREMYNVDYNSNTGTLEIQMRKEPGSTEFVGTPHIVSAAEIGKHYIDTQREPGGIMKFVRGIKEAITTRKETSSARTLGDLAGQYVAPKE